MKNRHMREGELSTFLVITEMWVWEKNNNSIVQNNIYYNWLFAQYLKRERRKMNVKNR